MEVYNVQPAQVDIGVTKVYDTRSAQAQAITVKVIGELVAQGSVLKAVIRNFRQK